MMYGSGFIGRLGGCYEELLFYGIATAGITSTIHHCGTFLRQIINNKPVVLYLDAIQTEVLRVRGASELHRWKSFQEIFGNYQRIRLFRIKRRPINDRDAEEKLKSTIDKRMKLLGSPSPPPQPQKLVLNEPPRINIRGPIEEVKRQS